VSRGIAGDLRYPGDVQQDERLMTDGL
jgi:hypothetical protein